MQRASIRIFAVLLVDVGIVAAASRFHPSRPAPTPHAVGLSVEEGGVVQVASKAPQWQVLRLGPVERATSGWTDPVPGRVRIDERRASKVGVPLPGRVLRVLVDLGQRVAKGDALFTVSSSDIAELRAQRERARVDHEGADALYQRVQAMVAANALPVKEELSAKQQLRQADVATSLAAAKLDALEIAPGDDGPADEYVVVSPRDGIVVEKNLVATQEVAPDSSSQLLVVADLSSVIVVADLFEDQATEIREGSRGEIRMSRGMLQPLGGVVETVSAIVDPSRHTVPIRVSFENPDGRLRPNSYVTVAFETSASAHAVQVPATAIVSDGEHQYVYAWGADDRFHRRDVVVGAARGGQVILLDGVTEGETILVEGGIFLDNQIQLGC